jgi:peptidyl-prolyl cis-trans isomerase A (cyclophilin A)
MRLHGFLTIAIVSAVVVLGSCGESRAPERFSARVETSKGVVVFELNRALAPVHVDRFYNLARSGFYDGARFYCVQPNAAVEFGINGDPELNRKWSSKSLPEEPAKAPNVYGTVSFARRGATRLYIDMQIDDDRLRGGGAPIGRVVSGLGTLRELSAEYGCKPDPQQIETVGSQYLGGNFPRLDYVKKASIDSNWSPAEPSEPPTVSVVTLEGSDLQERWFDPRTKQPRVRKFVDGVGEAALSPSKHYLTYAYAKGNAYATVLRTLSSGQERVLNTDSHACQPGGCRSVAWSPDESHLSFTSRGKLYAYTLATDKSVVVYSAPCGRYSDDEIHCATTPDGSWTGPNRLIFWVPELPYSARKDGTTNQVKDAFGFENSRTLSASIDESGAHLTGSIHDQPGPQPGATSSHIRIGDDPNNEVIAYWDSNGNLLLVDVRSGTRTSLGQSSGLKPQIVGWLPTPSKI